MEARRPPEIAVAILVHYCSVFKDLPDPVPGAERALVSQRVIGVRELLVKSQSRFERALQARDVECRLSVEFHD